MERGRDTWATVGLPYSTAQAYTSDVESGACYMGNSRSSIFHRLDIGSTQVTWRGGHATMATVGLPYFIAQAYISDVEGGRPTWATAGPPHVIAQAYISDVEGGDVLHGQ